MSRAHGNVSAKLRRAGSDPNVDDTENSRPGHVVRPRCTRGGSTSCDGHEAGGIGNGDPRRCSG